MYAHKKGYTHQKIIFVIIRYSTAPKVAIFAEITKQLPFWWAIFA